MSDNRTFAGAPIVTPQVKPQPLETGGHSRTKKVRKSQEIEHSTRHGQGRTGTARTFDARAVGSIPTPVTSIA